MLMQGLILTMFGDNDAIFVDLSGMDEVDLLLLSTFASCLIFLIDAWLIACLFQYWGGNVASVYSVQSSIFGLVHRISLSIT